MSDIFSVALELQQFCEDRDWEYCLIGGLALQRWGQPRVTQDVDCTILTGFGAEHLYVKELIRFFEPRIEEVERFASENRVLLLKSRSGVGIDISLGGMPYEERVIARASKFEFLPGVALKTCSAEDLIVLKSFAARTKDWADVESIIIRQNDGLDWDYILDMLTPLVELKEEPEIITMLNRLRANCN